MTPLFPAPPPPPDRDRLQMRLEVVTTMLEQAVAEVRRVMSEIESYDSDKRTEESGRD